jgi:hypothetical protein
MDDPVNGGLADTIGEMFNIPEANLDGQMLEMVSGDSSYQQMSSQEEAINGTNATANDDPLDAALIDLIPFP